MIDHRIGRLLVWGGLLLTMTPTAAAAQEATDSAALPAALHAARAEYLRAVLARDGAAVGALLADSAVAESDVERFVGRAAVVDGFLVPQLQGLSALRFEPSTFSRSGDDVVETATYFATPVDVGEEQGGTSITTWRQVAGAWRVVRLVARPTGGI